MQLKHKKGALAIAWVLIVGLAAVAGGVSSRSSMAFVAAIAVALPVILLWFWKDPDKTMSETIGEAR